MIKDLNKILVEWSYRTSDGKPDVKNRAKLLILENVLNDFGWSREARAELLGTLMEEIDDKLLKHKLKNPTTGRQNQVSTLLSKKKSDPAAYKIGKSFLGDKGVADDEIESQATKASDSISNLKKKIQSKNYPKTAMDREWTGKNTDEIADSVSTTTEPDVIPTKGSEDVSNRSKKSREEAFGGKAGKGGGETTIQEEMTNIGREITIANPNITKEEIASEIIKHVKKEYPDSKVANNSQALQRLANKSIAGFDSAKEIESNPSFNYNEEQPTGYPVNTTDSTIVRDTLVTQLREAEELGDEDKIKHAKNELFEFQKNAGDKSITGKEGDADTIVIYKDKNGNDRVCYISNKQSLNDQQSSGTVNSSRRSLLKAASKLELTTNEREDVVNTTEEQFNKADKFDERFAQGVKKAVDKHSKRLSTPQSKSTMAKAAQALTGRSKLAKPQSELTTQELNKKRSYITDSLKKPEVQAKLMGLEGPLNSDTKSKEYIEWKKETMTKFKEDGKSYSDEDITNSATLVTGTGGISRGNHLRTNEKVTIVTRDINTKMKKLIDSGLSPEEAAKQLKKDFDKPKAVKKGQQMYGGVFDEKDFIEIHTNEGLRDMETSERQRGKDIAGMQTETTSELKRLDKEAGHTPPPTNGKRTQAYVAGFLDRVHITQNVGGKVDGRKLTEMGEHSVSPENYRQALAKVTDFPTQKDWEKNNDGDYNQALEKHLVGNITVEGVDQQLFYIHDDTKRHIGTDTHRTGGKISKVAGAYGKDLQKAIAETSN